MFYINAVGMIMHIPALAQLYEWNRITLNIEKLLIELIIDETVLRQMVIHIVPMLIWVVVQPVIFAKA